MTWLFTAICLLGNILNVKKIKSCFYVWTIANILWLCYDIHIHLYSRAVLDSIQLILGIWGIVEWNRKDIKMKIKIIDFGYKNLPNRAHENDAGADVYATDNYNLLAGSTCKIPLGFGLELPDGYAACVFPRSGLSSKGIVCELPPIDSGYRGEIHAIVSNIGIDSYYIKKGDRIGQLVVIPVVIADFVTEKSKERKSGAFGSTGR